MHKLHSFLNPQAFIGGELREPGAGTESALRVTAKRKKTVQLRQQGMRQGRDQFHSVQTLGWRGGLAGAPPSVRVSHRSLGSRLA